MKKQYRNYFVNLIFPAFIFGSIMGILTAIVVTFYKVCAKYVIHLSESGYAYLREHLYLLPILIPVLIGLSFLFTFFYKKTPNLRGGGIPTSIGILRGLISFRWLRNLLGIFFLSLCSFLVGVPLGNEGPSVQMGTAIGRASLFPSAKKHAAWDRYAMTGGACAGFSVATGAPVSGILFAIEEAHQRISPMIVLVASTSVLFSAITAELLAPALGVSTALLPSLTLPSLSLRDLWIPALIGLALGLFAVLFLNYYKFLNRLFDKTLHRVPDSIKIAAVFVCTLILGLFSFSFISTGHDLIVELFDGGFSLIFLFLLLLLRSTLTICANSNGITGGIFLPLLALGAVLASLLSKTMESLFSLSHDYYALILALGITACIAGMMKMPLTAIIFSVEALGCHDNLLPVIIVSSVAFLITEIFDAKSINDSVLEYRVEDINTHKTSHVFDTFVTVEKDSFAIGKQIRDIFWPANLFVLSVKHSDCTSAEVDRHGGRALREGDILHVRYSTYDNNETTKAIKAIVGEQDYEENETDIV